ncbi:MAG: PP2C family protein-serine/threonine phosphatase [Acidobacteriota bacterium]
MTDTLTATADATANSYDPRTQPIYQLYRRMRRTVLSLDDLGDTEAIAVRLLEAVVERADEPGALVKGGRAYRRVDEHFELFATAGDAGPVEIGYRVPSRYPVIEQLFEKGWTLVHASDDGFDRMIEEPIGAEIFAAVVVGTHRDHFVSFTLIDTVHEHDLVLALISLAQVADMAQRQHELVANIEQTKAIQTSLLPARPPTVEGWDIAFRTRPALIVGGDAYEVRKIDGGLVVGIGDATGHGLPAALQARDFVVGLRMGIEQNLKLVPLMDTLSRVLNASSPANRFISMFFGELDREGNLLWSNAGHPPALLVRADRKTEWLESTGPVMAVPVDGRWEQRVTRLKAGGLLVLYTDGMTEAKSLHGEEFGEERLRSIVLDACDDGAEAVLERLYRALDQFTEGTIQTDDQTLVVVRRTAT